VVEYVFLSELQQMVSVLVGLYIVSCVTSSAQR
jgi:hypothetical protein